MLRWATIFFVIPLLVAVAGVSDLTGGIANVAVILCLVSLGAFLATFVIHPLEDEEEEYEGEWSR